MLLGFERVFRVLGGGGCCECGERVFGFYGLGVLVGCLVFLGKVCGVVGVGVGWVCGVWVGGGVVGEVCVVVLGVLIWGFFFWFCSKYGGGGVCGFLGEIESGSYVERE